ncbi:MAG TPA: Gldg family protein, partial [Chitinophagaceae bacterium]
MTQLIKKIFTSRYGWLSLLVVLFGINFLASAFHSRIDLTKEKRYTLSKATRELVNSFDDDVQIDVFLKGDFPAGFRKLANSTEEFLQLVKERNSSKIHYRFISPQDEIPGFSGRPWEDSLQKLGAREINLSVQVKEGQENKRVYPYAVVTYKGRQELVSLYSGGRRAISVVEMNSAEALMEYQFAKTLDALVHPNKPLVGYSIGNGEPDIGFQQMNGAIEFNDPRTADLQQSLSGSYQLFKLNLNKQPFIPDTFKVLIVVKPSLAFSEQEKLKIDQFVMRGGKLLFFIDNLIFDEDSIRLKTQTIAYDRNLNLTDMLFRYGVRINPSLIMDLQCDFMPFRVGGAD